MRNKLIIELRSDLCAGNGKGFGQVIDIDTAVDECGIPYIPGRRIKGCLRELAVDVLHEEKWKVDKLFGCSGSDRSGSLSVSDARIEKYDSQLSQVRRAIKADIIKPNDITELFCSVRATTALENETAKDKSLRFVRVVNRVSPIDHEPLKFYADITFSDGDQETVTRLVKGLRNIGYQRNRGLGSVKCRLENINNNELPQISQCCKINEETANAIEYLLYLESSLMLPEADANCSMDYIPGASVLGAFAGKYVKLFGEDGFQELFLSNQVRFNNLYISDRDGTYYMPAPGFLAKIKAAADEEGAGIHNQAAEELRNEERRNRGEELPQYKPLKKGYFSWEKGYKEPDTEIVYHNKLNAEDGGLYTQLCISAGQYYKGRIDVPNRLLTRLEPLFRDGVIYFGRSRNSQYARCLITSVNPSTVRSKKVSLEVGKTAAFLCESDIVLLQEGRYTVELEDLRRELERVVGIRIPAETLNKFTNITSRIVSGYNAKWNMKKPQFPVIRAGSVVVFQSGEAKCDLTEDYIVGARQNEGFGRVRLFPNIEAMKVSEQHVEIYRQNEATCPLLAAVGALKESDRILDEGIRLASRISGNPLNSSQIGRLILMCRESTGYDDFYRRIKSIKTEETRNKALSYFDMEKITEETKKDWKKRQRLFLTALTVYKYELRAGGKNDARILQKILPD